MPHNLATFTITVRVPGDNRTLPESKRLIELVLDYLDTLGGVEVNRNRGGSMLICTSPEEYHG